MLDMLRYHKFDMGTCDLKFGWPRFFEDFPYPERLLALSRVSMKTSYPAFMLISAPCDRPLQTQSMASRKMAAAPASGELVARIPILLDYRPIGGTTRRFNPLTSRTTH